MTQAERRHDRLAVRLSLIISRLVAGETLDLRTLATEFGVSVRTLRRDFRERLMYLDLEYRKGQCRLLSGGRQRELAVMMFARQSGVEALFPDMDNHLASSLLSGPMEAPCLIWMGTAQVLSPDSGVFAQLVNAVSEHRKVTLLGNGCRCKGLAPYRLVLRDGEWYLTGEHQARIAVFPLAEIRAVTLHNDSFTLDTAVRDILSCPDFLQALPHFRFINDVISTFRAELH
ncbi:MULTISPECIES: WYL domain-containing protein [Enterobacterales]|uniref:WYL domain-containing protein n=1 Tax=Raoultella planticola TaxID=575 RepID=A0ABU5M3M5_RAOPL|nr:MULTISPECIES: WYL domain-containing protein [Enterobacterales]MCH9405491.1 WYL domain-containing protein [Pantoea agglomerans]MDW4555225.1 WYL domain-containing protein [Raoultella planticola]MDZ7445970.1 WYL domain-containing protein [Raoultella planticola]MDZ7466809.1 WYL domain-containing protein [Raoultella planticola]MDZ7507777.1 WYL domain-containing protein [Raoultella planticola]